MNCSASGMFGPFIYFANSPADCERKAHAQGAVLKATVDLGLSLVCSTSAEPNLTLEELWAYGCQSVMGTTPIVSKDEYAVPLPAQVRKISLCGYGQQPWWEWPGWVHLLGEAVGVDDEAVEADASLHGSSDRTAAHKTGGVRVNSAGRPIHKDGRFMSYAVARAHGWKGGSSNTADKDQTDKMLQVLLQALLKQNLDAKKTARRELANTLGAQVKHYEGGQFVPGGGRAPAGGAIAATYKGGQFMPGGGRAPAGGSTVVEPKGRVIAGTGSTKASSTSRPVGNGDSEGGLGRSSASSATVKTYKGGQFIPGGGRAPTGGRTVTTSSRRSSYTGGGYSDGGSSRGGSGSSGGGGRFYGGGQFMPGGGRAPKGGAWS